MTIAGVSRCTSPSDTRDTPIGAVHAEVISNGEPPMNLDAVRRDDMQVHGGILTSQRAMRTPVWRAQAQRVIDRFESRHVREVQPAATREPLLEAPIPG